MKDRGAPRPLALDPDYCRQRSRRKDSERQEKRCAASLGGKRRPASGAMEFRKGDVACRLILVECKRTQGRSLSLKAEWLDKISREALAEGKEPVLHVEIQGVSPLTPRDWALVPLDLLRQLVGES